MLISNIDKKIIVIKELSHNEKLRMNNEKLMKKLLKEF